MALLDVNTEPVPLDPLDDPYLDDGLLMAGLNGYFGFKGAGYSNLRNQKVWLLLVLYRQGRQPIHKRVLMRAIGCTSRGSFEVTLCYARKALGKQGIERAGDYFRMGRGGYKEMAFAFAGMRARLERILVANERLLAKVGGANR